MHKICAAHYVDLWGKPPIDFQAGPTDNHQPQAKALRTVAGTYKEAAKAHGQPHQLKGKPATEERRQGPKCRRWSQRASAAHHPAEGQASNRGRRPDPPNAMFVTGERGEQTDWRASQHQRKAGKARGAVRGHNGPTQIMIQTHLIRFPVHHRYKQPNARTSNALRSSLCS